jgi:hypothetical protein
LELSHFAEGSPDAGWSFRNLQKVLRTLVGAFAFCRRFSRLWLLLSQFAEGSPDAGWSFRILQKVPPASVEAFAFCRRISMIDFMLLPFASAIFNAILLWKRR